MSNPIVSVALRAYKDQCLEHLAACDAVPSRSAVTFFAAVTPLAALSITSGTLWCCLTLVILCFMYLALLM